MIDQGGGASEGRTAKGVGSRSLASRWISSSRGSRKFPRGAGIGGRRVEKGAAGPGRVAGLCHTTNSCLTNIRSFALISARFRGRIGVNVCQIMIGGPDLGYGRGEGVGFIRSPMGGGALAAQEIRASFQIRLGRMDG